MRVLLIGGGGLVSGAIAETLRDSGCRVTALTRGRRPLPDGIDHFPGDCRDLGAVRAALSSGYQAVVDCLLFDPHQAEGMAAAAAAIGARYVMISTDFVYGPIQRWPMDEDSPTLALNAYGKDKAAAETVILAAAAEGRLAATVLRPPHVLGAGGHLGTGSVAGRDAMLLDRLQQRRPILLLDEGCLLIQPIYRGDLAQAVAAVLSHDATVGQAYNVAGPDCVTTRAYYDLIAATLGVEPHYLSFPSSLYRRLWPEKLPYAQHRMYSVERLAADTGFRPETSLHHGLFETIDWLQASGAAQPLAVSPQEEELEAVCRAFVDAAETLLTQRELPP